MSEDPAYRMSRRHLLVALAGSFPSIHVSAAERLQLIDLFPVFLRLWQEPDTPAQERVRRFRQLIIEPNADLYEAFTGDIQPERIDEYLRAVEPLVPAIHKLHDWVGERLGQSFETFRRELPDFKWSGPLVFMPNLFGFDAGSGTLDGKLLLIFGLDTIAKQYGSEADLSVLFTHELFHVYHQDHHPEWLGKRRGKDIPLYWLVWLEGLATYASKRLNPGAPEHSILQSVTLSSSCKPRLTELAQLLLNSIDSTDKGPFMEWMSGQARESDVPPRAGYYLGLLIAERLGRELKVRDLARLSAAEVRGRMVRALEALRSETLR